MRVLASIAALALPPMDALAARPFVTDDARLTTAQSCQLETWVRTYPDSREAWALPAAIRPEISNSRSAAARPALPARRRRRITSCN